MESESSDILVQLKESDFQRTYVIPYQQGGWIIGNYGDFYIVWLDNKPDCPVYVVKEDLAW